MWESKQHEGGETRETTVRAVGGRPLSAVRAVGGRPLPSLDLLCDIVPEVSDERGPGAGSPARPPSAPALGRPEASTEELPSEKPLQYRSKVRALEIPGIGKKMISQEGTRSGVIQERHQGTCDPRARPSGSAIRSPQWPSRGDQGALLGSRLRAHLG